MNNSLKIKQNSKWQLYAITVTSYDDGAIYTTATKVTEFKDLTKQYTAVVYKHNYNGHLQIKRTDDYNKAMTVYDGKFNTLSTSHACIITAVNDNDNVIQVQGRSSYRIFTKYGDMLLVKPVGIFL